MAIAEVVLSGVQLLLAKRSAVQVVPPTESDSLRGVTFSPEGNYIYFSSL